MIVSDTGPLIVLFKTDLLFLLREIYHEVLIPEAVADELTEKEEGILLLKNNNWIKITEVKGDRLLLVLNSILGSGEAEAIALALENDLPLLIDERKGRTLGRNAGIKIRGTLGVIAEAKKRGLIKSASTCIKKLKNAGYYIDSELIDIVLRRCRELQND